MRTIAAKPGNANYPENYEKKVILKDGSVILLRPIKPEDENEWQEFVSRVSQASLNQLRKTHPDFILGSAVRFANVESRNNFAFVAEVIKIHQHDIVAVGRYYRLTKATSAEVFFLIADEYQNKGIGTALMKWLAQVAKDNKIKTFEARFSPDNITMLRVFRDYGYHITVATSPEEIHVIIPLTASLTITRKEEERERQAVIESLQPFLSPRSIAIIGASNKPGTIGQLMVRYLIDSRYTGTFYPVNPNAGSVMAIKAYPSILDIPDTVDMAIIAVPAPIVAKISHECGQKHVRALVVISDGFKERGPEGAEREKQLRDIALGYGMRVVGPNCMGIINTDPRVRMNATFSPVFPPHGTVAFLSQSGAMGLVILEYAANLNMGISSFISIGNRVDVSYEDLLQYWEQDKGTEVILLYLESFGDPRKFMRIARRVSVKKPVVVVKSGNTPSGNRAAMSHTGAMATSEVTTDLLLRQAGIVRVNTMEELFDVATLMSNQPLPRGRRLAIVTDGGGPGIIAADASERNGLILPQFSDDLIWELKKVVIRDIQFNNPLDLTAGATPEEFENVLKILAKDSNIDAVLAMFIPPVAVETITAEDAIRRAAPIFYRYGKPLLTCFLGKRGFNCKLGQSGKYVPCYPFPEEAINSLAKTVEYAEMRRKPQGTIPRITGLKRNRARKIIEAAMQRRPGRPFWLDPVEISELLGCYGLRMVETRLTRTPHEAGLVVSTMGFPAAVKVFSHSIIHKTEVGGVKIDLNSAGEVESACADIKNGLEKLNRSNEIEGFIVQKMVKEGIETLVGVTQDPSFGPLIMFGMGGIYTELYKDIALQLHPLTDLDAINMIKSVKVAKLLEGFRGAPPSDTSSVENMLLRTSAMIEDLPQIAEIDFNPVKVQTEGQGYWIVDARIMVK
jgi:acetyl coenzyme A synthetase (ADP forming)-like protein